MNERQYQNIVESIPHGIQEIDLKGKNTFSNSAYYKISGYNKNDLAGKPVWELVYPDSEKDAMRDYFKMLVKDQPELTPWIGKNLTKDGRVIDINIEWNYKFDEKNNLTGFIAVITDITMQKKAEEELLQRTNDLELLNYAGQTLTSTLDLDEILITLLEEVRKLLGIVASSIWLIDPETKELVCRQASGPSKETVRGWRLEPGIGIAGWVALHGKSLNVPETRTDKRHYKELDERTGLTLNSILSSPLKVKHNVIGVIQLVDTAVGFFNDTHLKLLEPLATSAAIAIENARLFNESLKEILDRKKAEEQINASLKEKEILLDEIHHRVKNNLQVISSILDMSSLKTKDKKAIQLFSDAIGKINTMSLLYSELYQNDRFDRINMNKHINNVINYLKQLYKVKKDLVMNISVDPDITLTLPQGVPLTLVLTELTANALKHAFKNRNNGTVEISFHKKDNKLLCLKIKDNGIGIPDEIEPNTTDTLGLKLTRNIVTDQLNGIFNYKKNGGAEFIIEFNP